MNNKPPPDQLVMAVDVPAWKRYMFCHCVCSQMPIYTLDIHVYMYINTSVYIYDIASLQE